MSVSFDSKYIKFSAVASSTLNNGLVAYWKMDEVSGTVIDAVGNNDGTVTGTPTRNGAGIKSGYTFDGTEYISCGDDSSLKVPQITINAWVQTNPSFGNIFPIYCHQVYISPYGIGLFMENEYVRFSVSDVLGTHYLEITGVTNIASATVWHMVTVTSDGTYLRMYIDGAIETLQAGGTTGSYPYDLGYTTGDIQARIGYRDADTLFMIGSIDEVGIWDRALIASEITELYNSSTGKTHPFS